MAKPNWKFATRLNGIIALLVLLIFLMGLGSFLGLQALYQQFYTRITPGKDKIAVLTALADQSMRLAVNSAHLTTALATTDLLVANAQLSKQLAEFEETERKLSLVGISRAMMEQLRQTRQVFAHNLQQIPLLVQRRTAIHETNIRNIFQVKKFMDKIHTLDSYTILEPSIRNEASQRGILRWIRESERSLALMLAAQNLKSDEGFYQIRHDIMRSVDSAAAALGALDGEAWAYLEPLHRDLVALEVGSEQLGPSLFTVFEKLSQSNQQIQNTLTISHEQSDRIFRLIRSLMKSTEIGIRSGYYVFGGQISTQYKLVLIFGLIGFTLAIFALILVHRTITRPIGALRDWIDHSILDSEHKSEHLGDDIASLTYSMRHLLDIDVRREKLLQQEKERAENENKSKISFLAMISHEVRTPLNGIIGVLELLELNNNNNENSKLLKNLRHSSLSLLKVLDNVLDFSKIEAKKMDLNLIPSSLLLIFQSLSEAFYATAVTKNITIRFFIDPQIPTEILIDPIRLRQVLINLVSNALKFTNHGHVDMIAELVERHDNQVSLRLSVQDTGIGIPEDKLESLFEPFYQVGKQTPQEVFGTGLGLSICKRLVNLMDGLLVVDSKLGVGSSFHVLLEAKFVNPKAILTKGEILPSLEGCHILLLETDHEQRRFFTAYLEQVGAHVNQVGHDQEISEIFSDSTLSLNSKKDGAPPKSHQKIDLVLANERFLQNLPSATDALPPMILVKDHLTSFPQIEQNQITQLYHPLSAETLIHTIGFALKVRGTNPAYLRRVPLSSTSVLSADGKEYKIEQAKAFEIIPPVEPSPSTQEKLLPLPNRPWVLLAEDQSINHEVMIRQFRALGINLDVAFNGREALEKLRYGHYKALFTDYHMPEMDGAALTREIRRQETHTGHHLPIIAVTADVTAGHKERCRVAGMDDHFSKPLRLRNLRAAIERWVHPTLILASSSESLVSDIVPEPSKPDEAASWISQILNDPETPINPTMICELYVGREAEIYPMIITFFDSLETQRRNLRDALKSKNEPMIAHIAHTIKGPAATLGIEALVEMMETIEQAIKQNDWPKIKHLADESMILLQKLHAFRENIDSRPI